MAVRVLGIDPGLSRMGFGVIEERGSQLYALSAGTLTTSPQEGVSGRLATLYGLIAELIEQWRPEAVAVERVFLKLNAATAVPSIQAAGLALMCGARSGAEVHEYSPAEVKLAVTGSGNASKEQIRFMVKRLIAKDTDEARLDLAKPDAADGLAIAITHLFCRGMKRLEAAAR